MRAVELAHPAGEGTPSTGLAPGTLAREGDRAIGIDPQVGLARLALVFLWLGAMPTGGRMVALLFDEFGRRRGWLRTEDLAEGQTLAKVLPGNSGMNLTVFIAQMLRGPRAAAVCLACFLVPGALAMVALAPLLLGDARAPWVEGAMRGIAASAIGLLLVTAWQLVPAARVARSWRIVAALAFAAVGVLGLDLLLSVLGLGLLSLWRNRPVGSTG